MFGCIILTSQAWGQVAKSPFSQYAFGDTYTNALANTQGTGTGVSQPQFWFINNQNPALLIYNSYSTFQAGALGERKTISNSSGSEKFKGGNMNYLVMAFPVKQRKWTTSLGLMPYSSMNYKVQSIDGIEGSNGTVLTTREGKGGISQLYWSNGVRIYKDFSLGLKATYLFGAVDRSSKFNQIPIVVVQDKSHVKDFTFSLGASYSKDSLWGDNYRLSVGAVYEMGADVRTFLYNKISSLGPSDDTLRARETRTSGYTHLPPSITAGASIGKGMKWSIGTEFKYQDWSSFKTMELTAGSLDKSWSASLGGEFTPDPDAIEGFLKRLTYRVGVSQAQYPYLANAAKVKDLGINFGFSIPTGRSSIDLAFKVGSRGNKDDNSLKESYFRVYLGFTFNDVWFIKRKFD